MPPKSGSEKFITDKAKFLMEAVVEKTPERKMTFKEFQKEIKRTLDVKKKSLSDFLAQLSMPNKKKSDKLFLSMFNLSLISVVSDNKLGVNETANFKEKLQSHFHFLRAALIEQQIKVDKKEFENINITNTKLLKGAKFQEANKRLIQHKNKKNKYYDALLATLPSGSNTSKEIIEQAKYNLETNIEKEILTNKEFSIYYNQVFKVSSDPGKKGREIYGMKGPNFIAVKDESGNIFLTQMVLNPKSGRFDLKGKKKINWFDLMLELNRNRGKYQMKEVSVDQIPYTNPPRYQKMEGDFAVKAESFRNQKIEFEEKKIFANLKRLFMQEGLENLNEDEKKLLGKSAKEVFAKYNTHMVPFYRNGDIPFNLSYTASFKNMDIKDRMVIFRKLYNDLIRTQEKYLIQQQLEGTKGLKPTVKLFFEGELAFRRGVNFKAYNKYSKFLDKISTSKEKFNKKKELIIRARMNLRTLSLRIIDVAEKYLIASGANETWHPYAKKEHKVLVKFRELISSGKAKDLDQAWNMMPKKNISMAGGSGKSRLSKIIAGENKQLKGKPGGWGMSETGSPILDRFRGLVHMDEKEFKAAMYKMAQEVRKKGMIIKGMAVDIMTDGKIIDPRQINPLYSDTPLVAKFTTEGIAGAAGVLFRELMKDDMANMRSLLYNESVESSPSLGEMKTEWKNFNKIWNTVTRKKEKKSYSMVMDNYRNQLKSKKNAAEFTKQAKQIAIQVSGGKEKFNNLSTEQQFVQIDRYRNLIKSKAISDYEEKVVFNKYINSGFCKANKKVKNTYKDMMGIGGGIWNPSDAETKQMIETAAMFVFDAVTLLAPSAAVGRLGAKVVQYAGQRLMTKVIAKGGSTFWRSRAAQLGLSALAYGGGEIVGFHTMHSYLLHRRGVEELFGPRKYLEGLAHTAAFLIPMHVGGRLISPRLGRLTGAGKVPTESIKALQKMWMKAKPRLASVVAFEAPAMTILNKILDKKSGSFGKEYLNSLLAIAQFELGGKIFNSATGNIVPRGAERIAMRTKIFELKASGQKVDASRAKMIEQMMKDKTIPVESMHALAHLKPEQMRNIQDYLIENADVKLAIDLVSKGKDIPKGLKPAYDYLIGNLKSMGLNAKQAKKILQSLSMDRLITLRESYLKMLKRVMAEKHEGVKNRLSKVKFIPTIDPSKLGSNLANIKFKSPEQLKAAAEKTLLKAKLQESVVKLRELGLKLEAAMIEGDTKSATAALLNQTAGYIHFNERTLKIADRLEKNGMVEEAKQLRDNTKLIEVRSYEARSLDNKLNEMQRISKTDDIKKFISDCAKNWGDYKNLPDIKGRMDRSTNNKVGAKEFWLNKEIFKNEPWYPEVFKKVHSALEKKFIELLYDPWGVDEAVEFYNKYGEGLDVKGKIINKILDNLKNESFDGALELKDRFKDKIQIESDPEYVKAIKNKLNKSFEKINDKDPEKFGGLGDLFGITEDIIKIIDNSGVNLTSFNTYQSKIQILFKKFLQHGAFLKAFQVKDKLGQDINFKKLVIEEIIIKLKNNKLDEAINIKLGFGAEIDILNEVKKIIKITPRIFVYFANKPQWIDKFGKEAVDKFLDALPKSGDEKRNAFTHNKYDRTSRFFQIMVEIAKESKKDYNLSAENFDITTAYVKKFKLSSTLKLYEYFRNIELVKRGKLKALPEGQIKEGITTIKELELRYKKIKDLIFGLEPITDLSKFGEFEIDLLANITGKSTHLFNEGRQPIEEIIREFQQAYKAGEIAPIPEHYRQSKVVISEAVVKFNAKNVKKEFDVLKAEILNCFQNPNDVNSLSQEASRLLSTKVKEFEQILKNKPNPFIEKQLKALKDTISKIAKVTNLDSLMEQLLTVERSTAEKFGVYSVMRKIIINKVLAKNYSPQALRSLLDSLRQDVNSEGIVGIVNLFDNIIKDHVLNAKGQNKEGYWKASTWKKIIAAKKAKKLIDSVRIFDKYLRKLRVEVANFKTEETGIKMNVDIIPDKGFIGEMSGYLANACYTAEQSLLKNHPNLVPEKFVIRRTKDSGKELFGSVLLFELKNKNGEKVILIRAFNVPNEIHINIGKFIENYLDRLTVIAKKRGAKKIIIPGIDGAISNGKFTISYLRNKYIEGKTPISLDSKFAFNDYDITKKSYVVREIR